MEEKGDTPINRGREAQRLLPYVCMDKWTFASKPNQVSEGTNHGKVSQTCERVSSLIFMSKRPITSIRSTAALSTKAVETFKGGD